MESTSSTVPSPRTGEGSAPRRRPSLTLSPHLAASHPIAVPSRHGTLSNRSPRSAHETLSTSSSLKRPSRGSFGSLSLSGSLTLGSALLSSSADVFGEEEDEDIINVDAGEWLNTPAADISLAENEHVVRIRGDVRLEEAVMEPTICLSSRLMDKAAQHSSTSRLTFSDISGKNPYHSIDRNAPLGSFIQLYGRGIHRVAIEGDRVLSHESVLRHLLGLERPPSLLEARINSKLLRLNLHPLISVPTSSSVLDAMQIMRRHGLRVLGILGEARRTASGDDSSPLLIPADESKGVLVSVVRAKDCAKIVVPSEGKRALTMSLTDLVKLVESEETAGRERGEERMPSESERIESSADGLVHTLPPSTTLVYACHLILATSSSRVFVRNDFGPSPVVSPSTEPSSLPVPPAQLSPHCVLSIVDVFKCLTAVYT
uniref:CBS domain-containing protein n=1 Tax=Kwoniella bestiolae CBS 10118 TaxID=1296100 RepID=A0A1B9FQW7_9TREE|nr:hypothetical protein I302_08861 [Kwoniella bestiolae CBS 10118]OCF21190.1 hypothetical protein I302_08861 [Kwoniella bestiolae CBS 10118]